MNLRVGEEHEAINQYDIENADYSIAPALASKDLPETILVPLIKTLEFESHEYSFRGRIFPLSH